MKSSFSLRTLTACVALSTLLPLSACSFYPSENLPSVSTSPITSTVPDTVVPDDSITAYESVIAELREALLHMKETDYITRAEYEARIRALEERLADLQSPTESTDLPVWSVPTESTHPSDTKKEEPTQDPSATMAFRYSINDGAAVIYEYLGSEVAVTIPAVIDGYPVTRIADEAFRGTAVTSVVIPYSVLYVGWFAFADCQSLATVILTQSVESIDYGAFDGCPHVTLYCPPDSYAAQYAASFALQHEYI